MNQNYDLKDTIVAPATAMQPAAVAIVRLAGPKALHIARQLSGKPHFGDRPQLLTRVRLQQDDGQLLDDAMAVYMRAPQTYTGDDVVELHLHGSVAVVQAVIAACQRLGARSALSGEFTWRAFMLGKLDLTQATAVQALVQAEDGTAQQAALRQLQGMLSQAVQGVLDDLTQVLTAWRAAVDFPDYDTSDGLTMFHVEHLQAAAAKLAKLQASVQSDSDKPRGVVLCGAPNVGKSTLVNAWLGYERVLVAPQAGTTRDAIEVELQVGSKRLRLWDTAGLRDAAATSVEARGIALGKRAMHQGSCVIWLLDPLQPVWPEAAAVDLITHVVVSKTDLVPSIENLLAAGRQRGLPMWGGISASQATGLDALKQTAMFHVEHSRGGAAMFHVEHRVAVALAQAQACLAQALAGFAADLPIDIVALDVEQAAKALGQVLGREVDAEVIDNIFKQFCIGK